MTLAPVPIDLETRSACDLKVAGGWTYATHPTTKLLTVSWSPEKDLYYLWLPTVDEFDRDYLHPPSDQLLQTHLADVRVIYGPDVPEELRALASRPWAAHNAMTFDKPVWDELGQGVKPVSWVDTYPLALACGLPGGLNAIGKVMWGEGKYEEGNTIAKEATRVRDPELADPRNVPIGALVQVGRYNVQDVRLLSWLLEEIERTGKFPEVEKEVLSVHHTINSRGARVDTKLLASLARLSTDCRTHAITEITTLTNGRLSSQKDLNSRKKVFEWLDFIGVDVGKSLRKEIIKTYIEKNTKEDAVRFPEEVPTEDDGEDAEGTPVSTSNLPLAIKVLELRMSAMKITDGKLAAASQSVNADGRVRGLFAYWAAHTGRWAGRRIQVHNLPKPKEGVDVWSLLNLFEETGGLDYLSVRGLLPLNDPMYRFLTPDDAASALIRSLFTASSLAAADLSNIEARVLAWLAGEDWLMQSFWSGDDPYMTMAERVFGRKETWAQYPDPKNPGQFLPLKKHPFRQAGKELELASGFQVGEVRLAVYFGQKGIDINALGTSPRECTHAYRDSHSKIAGTVAGEYKGRKYYRGGFWEQLNNAAIAACETPGPQIVGRITFEHIGGHLMVLLPSGRRLVYRSARVANVVPSYARGTGKTVRSVQYLSPRFGWNTLYGGKIAENVTQAVARDFLAWGLVQCERHGIPVVLHVHDEIVGETDDLPLFMSCVTSLPPWAPEFPLDAEGNLAPRYAKSPPPGVKEIVYRNGRKL